MKLKDLLNDEINHIIVTTAENQSRHVAIVEKDFWVTVCLHFLFEHSLYKEHLVFKGGTSLSKAYNVIERFSEDIDLILDWRKLGYTSDEPYKERSKNKQGDLNKEILEKSADFISQELLPDLQRGLEALAGMDKQVKIEIDSKDPNVINIKYPRKDSNQTTKAILPYIRLEIGALAAWTPSHKVTIEALVTNDLGQNTITIDELTAQVMTVDIKRTFWEKATILHQEYHRPKDKKTPERYSRHYYDLYLLSQDKEIRLEALEDKDLLSKVVHFKNRFYPVGWAKYEEAIKHKLRLVPDDYRIAELKKDYEKMKDMIYGKYYSFDEIICYLKQLEKEVNEIKNDLK